MGMNAKKVVLKLDLHDDKDKQRAMKVVSKLPFIDSITVDMKDKKLTVIGDVDPIDVVNRLRKYWNTDIASVGPAKEPEKKKDDGNNNKKDDGKKDGGNDKKKGDQIPMYNPYVMPYYPHIVTYNPQTTYPQQYNTHYPQISSPYYVHNEENPNACIIC